MSRALLLAFVMVAAVLGQETLPEAGATLSEDVSDADFAVCDDSTYCVAGQRAISACTNDLTPNVKIVPVVHGVIKSQVTQHQNAIAPPVRLGQVLIKPAKQIIVSFVSELVFVIGRIGKVTPCPIGFSGNGQTVKSRDTACDPCQPGFAQNQTGQSECTECIPGYTFQILEGQSTCSQCSVCGNTQYIQTPCSSTSDTVCGDCTCENTSCDPNSGVCANDVCGVQDGDGSTCCAGNPNYCGVSGTCVGGTTDLSCVCGPGYGIKDGVCVQCSSEQPFEFNGANDTSPCGNHTACEDNFRFEYNATQEGCVPCDSGFELDQSGDGFLTTCTQIDDCNCPTGDTCVDAMSSHALKLFNKD